MKKEFLEPYPVCKEKESLVEEQIYLLIFPVATIFAKGYTVIQKRRIKRNEQIMRKIILSCLLLGISLTTYAQTSLFDLWQEASEHVNIYTYGLKPVKKDPCFRPDWKQKRGTKLEISSPTIGLLKKMLEDVESEGFQFNPQNDTLLFYVSFCSWWAPCDLVVKTSAGISHYYKPTESRLRLISVMLAEDFFISSILYYGDNSAFTDFFRRYVILDSDSYAADTLVFRIILKDGKIMTPSEVWKLPMYICGENYLLKTI